MDFPCFVGVVGLHDIGMRQFGGGFDLAMKARDRRLRRDQVGRQHFERDDPLHPAMPRETDDAHAAGAEFVEHDIVAQHQAGRVSLANATQLVDGEFIRLDEMRGERIDVGCGYG